MSAQYNFEIPPKAVQVFAGKATFRGMYGGRSSGKSATFAAMSLLRGYETRKRIVCAREIQKSLKTSVKAELEEAIHRHWFLEKHYKVLNETIRGKNGTEFIFEGLKHNINDSKSLSNADITWIEEAETVSENSWRVFLPTIIRKPGSECWISWNRETENSATDKRFIKNPPAGSRIIELNWRDNPWFSAESETLRQMDAALDAEIYDHVWEGNYLKLSNARILAKKLSVREFTPGPGWDGPYYGLDFGFSADPSALTETWIHDNRLWVYRESGGTGIELDYLAAHLRRDIPGIERFVIRADNARPESISYLQRHGLPYIKACEKWPGSVEDGIAHLKSYSEIVVHPNCEETRKECLLYSYKLNKAGDVLPDIIDKYNHYIDATRYGVGPLIKRKATFYIGRA